MTAHWYRYQDHLCAPGVDEFGRTEGVATVYVTLRKLPVLKETPCGVWLDDYGTRRFVRSDARKRYACPTIEDAKESFLARKERQASILTARLRQVNEAIARVTRRGRL